ncbi:MAG: hypothetical protein GEU26_04680 [Nitrososphaeraceae archaeon]|nr:hypothetical protein [Nitrososphaeraceae archaeon]
MLSSEVRYVSRPVIGKAKTLFAKGLYSDLNDAIREGISNSMSWMHVAHTPIVQKKIYITINVGNTNDLWIEDFGPGITDYEKFKNIGHDPNDEVHNARIKDPEFISQIGIGINSLLWLSKDNTVKFYSVSLDKENRKNGLIATLMMNNEDIFFIDPPERPDSQYVLDHVGLRVVVKNARDIPIEKIRQYVSRKFILKLKDYPVFIKDAKTDQGYTRIFPSTDFCTKHMNVLFYLSDGTEVKGDLHNVDDMMDSKLSLCIKKVENSEIIPEHMGRGIITCNSLKLEFKADRSGMIVDEDTLYPELKKSLELWMADNGFQKPTIQQKPKIKNEKGLEDVLSDIFASLSDLYPYLSIPISGQPDVNGIEGRIVDEKRSKREWEIHKINQKIVLADSKLKDETLTRNRCGPRKELQHPVIAKSGMDPQYHGYGNGGTHTVLKRKGEKLESTNGLIRPMPPTELLPRGRNDPVVIMEQYENKQKKKGLRIVINTISPLSDIIISSVGAKQRATVTPYLCKAVIDYIAKSNRISIEEYSQMWENLQVHSQTRGRFTK